MWFDITKTNRETLHLDPTMVQNRRFKIAGSAILKISTLNFNFQWQLWFTVQNHQIQFGSQFMTIQNYY